LHLKYRPKTWDEVIGNAVIKKSLQSLTYNRPILLQGERGCGKTTLAYIIAQSFGAIPLTINDYDCGLETSKAELTRRLEELHKSNIFGNKQVLILDEVHLLSQPAKQELLKPTESEKLTESSLIIACTTEPTKLPKPLYDRFLTYEVRPLTVQESLQLLNTVMQAENIVLDKSLKVLLIEKSEGIPRRILTGLARIKDVEDEDEAAYLLDIAAFEDDKDILDIFKVLISQKHGFMTAKELVKTVLKTKSAETIRVGLMNITSGRIMSNYFDMGEKAKLIKLYNALREAQGYPEKANLIIALLKGA
jgi:replication factor C large subunit